MTRLTPHVAVGLTLLTLACAGSPVPETGEEKPDEPQVDIPIDCPGMDGHVGVLRPLTEPEPRIELASFPLSVPSIADLDGTLWLFAQMFEDEERHCDVIGMAPLMSLPSEAAHPLTPLTLHGLPELGYPNPDSDRPFPPADPDVVVVRDEVVLITTLRLATAPQEPCIALSVARDPVDPTAGFDHLDGAMWCEPGVALMDASGWFDAATEQLHLVFSDFTSGPGTVVNWHARFDVAGAPESWRLARAERSAFGDFHLFGTFDLSGPDCPGAIFYGTSNAPGMTGTRSACFDGTNFESTELLVSDVRDPAVATDPSTGARWLAFSAQ